RFLPRHGHTAMVWATRRRPGSPWGSRMVRWAGGKTLAVDDALRPIPGTRLGPDHKDTPKAITKLEQRRPWVHVGWAALQRFKAANTSVIAGGTAYYAFVAMF